MLGSSGSPQLSDPDYIRPIPPLVLSGYSGTVQEVKEDGDRSAIIDLSNVSKGYIAATATAAVRAKLKIEAGGQEYIFDHLDNTGNFEVFPLTLGNGEYVITIYLHMPDHPEGANMYEVFLRVAVPVTLESEFAPFLVPNQTVNYGQSSELVQFSYELGTHAKTDTEFVAQVYRWIVDNITYDTGKADILSQPQSEVYIPDPDETLRTKTGICYDYAALAAAMLRANGIPCQLVKGDVLTEENGQVRHAWNNIWLQDGGMITATFSARPGEWQRIDLTFAASRDPAIEKFIGDGQNYYPLTVV